MVFHSFSVTFFLLAIHSSLVRAAPWPLHAKHATHRVRHVGRSLLQVQTFHPKTTFKTYGSEGKAQQGVSLVTAPLNETAMSFVQSELGVSAENVGYKSGYSKQTGKYAYVKQYYEGVPFANAVANIAWNDGKVVAFGSSFVGTGRIANSTPTLGVADVIPQVEEALDGKYNDYTPSLEYFAKEDGSVALTHVLQIRNETAGTWFEAFVCAHTGNIVSVTDFVSHASYTVVPISRSSFAEGQVKLTNPQDLFSSPLGWHDDGTGNVTFTVGNNVNALADIDQAAETSSGLNFNVAYDDSRDPTTQKNIAASRINAFYIANTVHDFAYRYGFTEEAFNFQLNNFDKGGKGRDRVFLSVQDDSGLNNANFVSPPDGQAGVCRMFIWDLTNPRRDGAMENDILVHELAHGITNRMTGGGTGRCLQTIEAGGLGEGWSDAMANWVSQKSSDIKDFAIGTYVTNNPKGIRTRPYSTDANVNPLRYSSLAQLNEVHKIGEVWANMLHNVYAALVAKHGFSNTALTNPDTTEGNVIFMHLFIDALALQPCNPTFVEARDAWIQADQNRYNGENKCLVFKEFARLGLGLNAGSDFTDNDDLPSGC